MTPPSERERLAELFERVTSAPSTTYTRLYMQLVDAILADGWHRVPTEPSEASSLEGEMIAQAKLGYLTFCLGVHESDECDWIEWDEAFAMLRAALRAQEGT